MLRKLSIILALGAALAVPSAAMARGGGRGGGGGFGGFHGGGGGGWGGYHGGGLARGYYRRGYGYGWGGYYDRGWGDYWPFYGYDDSYYNTQPVYYVVHVHHYASRCHNVNRSIWHHGLRYWRTVRVCRR